MLLSKALRLEISVSAFEERARRQFDARASLTLNKKETFQPPARVSKKHLKPDMSSLSHHQALNESSRNFAEAKIHVNNELSSLLYSTLLYSSPYLDSWAFSLARAQLCPQFTRASVSVSRWSMSVDIVEAGLPLAHLSYSLNS